MFGRRGKRCNELTEIWPLKGVCHASKRPFGVSATFGVFRLIAGSKVNAGEAVNIEGDSVAVIGAQETDASASIRKKSGLFAGSGGGFFSLWGKESKQKDNAATQNVGSELSAGTDVNIKARESDVNIIGSSVEAGRDIALDAARDVNITPGAESAASHEKEERSGFGIQVSSGNGSASIGIGFGSSKDETKQGAETNAVSSLNAGRDVIITAGRDANLQAAQVEAGSTVDILAERDVNLLCAQDKTNYQTMHEELFAGVTATVSSSVAAAAQDVYHAAQKIGEGSSSQSAAMAAIAGINGYYALDALTNPNSTTPLLSTSLSVGFQYQKSSSEGSATTPVPTVINAGDTVVIEAVTGDINAVGAQVSAGYNADGTLSGGRGDIALIAGDEINLASAEATTRNSSKSVSGGVGIDLANPGVSFDFGQGKANGSTVTNLNTHVDGTGTVYMQSGGDTNLRGGTVSGETVIADVGGDLNIESQLDTASQKARQLDINGGIGAASSGGAGGISGSYQTARGDAAIVSEQSGIHAGKGGFDIETQGKTKLEGGLITSEASSGNNRLETGTLEFSDIDTHSKWKADTYGGGISGAGISVSPHLKEGESETGKALSAISPGGIVITDPANQQQNIDDLRRDTTDTNTSLPGIPDLQKKLSEQLKTQQLYDAAAARAAKMIGDKASELAAAALEKGEAGKAEYEFWKEGGPGRAALHAIAGGLLGGVTDWNGVLSGALGGAISSLLAPKVRELVEDFVKQSGLTGAAAEMIINTVTSSILAGIGGVGGGTGAAYATNAYQHNFLTHKQIDELKEALIGCEKQGDAAACKAAVSKTYSDLDFEQEKKLDACRTVTCVQDLLGDPNQDPRIGYMSVLELQELGLDNAVAQRLLANQVLERGLTGDASVFEQRLMDVAAGVGYCQDSGGTEGCFLKGQALKYTSDSVNATVFMLVGVYQGGLKTGGGKGASIDPVPPEQSLYPSGTLGAGKVWTKSARINDAQLPSSGRIRYVPPETWDATTPLPRGPNKGYMDKFGNEWTRGPSRTQGQAFEWDVQLSRTGREQIGWATRDGSHANVSLDGKITHK